MTPRWFRVLDDRLHFASGLRRQLNKVFPTRWSFLLGEIALYCFVVLLLSGTYLALFFDPSMAEVRYQGAYTFAQGLEVSRAYASGLDISFEVRGGLFARQVHHWAALVFMAAIVVHMLRIFFTGAFRRPREGNWVIGISLFALGMAEGFAGYSLPDDLLSGTGLRIMSGIVLSIPVIGTWLHWAVFGGEYPDDEIIPRLYTAHVFLLPGLLVALVAVHLGLIWYQKHTQAPGPRRTERNVVGVRIVPIFAAKSAGLFIAVVGVLALMGGLLQINPIWNYGPYRPAAISAGSQPDWYIAWIDGAGRLWPPWEIALAGYRLPGVFWPMVFLPVVVLVVAAAYPWIERRFTGDTAHHNLIQRPRDVPVRSALGAMALTFFVVLLLSGFNDTLALELNISLNAAVWIGRLGLLFLPPLAYYAVYRLCLGLQRTDREVLHHGIETGIIRRRPDGGYLEIHQPIGPADDDGDQRALPYMGTPVPKRMNEFPSVSGQAVPGSLLSPDPRAETEALRRARAADHEETR
ncbi:ubiquinol-cytochrome c reductase cytochrome b subunit [Kibdelosporangium aridum]|uniref:Cytochrome bc1 complex cytochrome b subunit n=1 Tax=Kibdelosporangium aridum TaxID=2030 RepID=A0A428ZAZ1_KIBAR|nr:ubiquinol-cytochrome c reductase cytochrome b subunit [Kibdelosporangium aridum]RSM85247.1 ubiquinol-cytochrome c reductase cytochrome b subunit [Kibdelosporangium aridum]